MKSILEETLNGIHNGNFGFSLLLTAAVAPLDLTPAADTELK